MRVPTEGEWGDYQADLEQDYAHKMFAGRTNQEMLPHFRRDLIKLTGELRSMPQVPFRYYMLGFRDFVMSEEAEDSDAASCFLRLVLEKLEEQPDYILPIMPELLQALRHVAQNQALFGAAKSIYGSFRDKLAQIERLCMLQPIVPGKVNTRPSPAGVSR
jgi:hypothetical protein